MHKIREKKHRLPLECYRGKIFVAFTANTYQKTQFFIRRSIVSPIIDMLERALVRNDCVSPAYCFMPNHLHIIIHGLSDAADTWRAMVDFKQLSGYWFSKNNYPVKWQKDFYDHIIRKNEDLAAQIQYIWDNPVRKKLVSDWKEYPFIGAIRYEVNDMVEGFVNF